MANRPNLFAFLDRLLTNIDPNYAENNLNLTGVQPGQVIQSVLFNTLQLVNGLWTTYFDYKTIKTVDQVDESTDQRWTADKLEYANGQSVIAGPGADPEPGPTVYYFGGYRVEIDECILKPNGADPLKRPLVATPGRVWIYLDVNVIADPGQPFATLFIEDVAAGALENPGPGQLPLVGVDISATGLTAGNVYPASEPDQELRFNTLLRAYTGLTQFEDTATFSKPGFDAVVVNGAIKITSAAVSGITAGNDSAANSTTVFTNVSGTAATCTGTHATKGALEAVNGGAGPSVLATKAVAGSAVKADSTVGGGAAVEALGGSFGVDASSTAGSAVRGTTTTGVGIEAVSSGAGNAIAATGGPNAASRAASLLAGDPAATTLLAVTDPAATTAAVAVQGTANGDGTGVRGLGLDGYGVIAQTDTSSPTRSAFRIVPQDADPSTPAQGDVYFNDNRGGSGIPRIYKAAWASLHASPKGRVFQFGLRAAGGPIAGGSGNLSLAQVTPEEVGDVLIEGTGSLDFSLDTGACTVELWDITANVLVAIQTERSIDVDGAMVRDRSFVIRGDYTLPNAATRTFAVVITAVTGTIDYLNVITTVQGVQ